MTRTNAEIVRRLYEGLNSGVLQGPGAAELVGELFDPEVEMRQLDGIAGTSGTFHGYAGLFQAQAEIYDVFVDVEWRMEEHVEFDGGIVSRTRILATGGASGLPTETPDIGHLFELRAGRIVRFVVYGSFRQALAAAGLE
jgi:ketosteroid isomerase-like protein